VTEAVTEQGTLAIPEAEHRIDPTPLDLVDQAVATLEANRKAWVQTTVDDRIALLDELLTTTLAAAPAWTTAAAVAKGIDRDSPLMGEDWVSGPSVTLRNLRLLKETLEEVRDHGAPQVEFVTRHDGQVAAKVFPSGLLDQAMFPGFRAEVWLEPDVTLEEARASTARIYRPGGKDDGGVALVLGAGNVSSIAPMDVLYKLFVEDRVCVLKMNPVNEHLGPHLAAAMAPLVERDLLRLVYGGAEVGAHLSSHPQVDEIHITGSDKTHDAIVFGPGPEGRERKARGERLNDKPISSELGNVSPVIVVPGPWSDADVRFQADNLTSMLVQNAGFNCIAARVFITHASWARRRPLLDAIRDSLRAAEPRVPYYPGAVDRWRTFVEAHPQAEWFGPEGEDRVPFTFIPGLDPDDTDDVAFTTEAFCGVVGEAPLDAPRSVPEYIAQAVEFCNDTLWGTLSASIVVHPASLRDPAIAQAVDRAIEDLRYGSVVVNHWSAVPYGLVSTTWGAYPGHTDTDIQSGRGVVHNTKMLERPQKSVVWGPFRMPTTPVWFHTNRTLHKVGPVLAEFEATQDLTLLPRLLWHAARG
jgi:hypothetical protein